MGANKRYYLPLAKICLAKYSRSAVTSLLWLEFDLVSAMLCLRDGGVGGRGAFKRATHRPSSRVCLAYLRTLHVLCVSVDGSCLECVVVSSSAVGCVFCFDIRYSKGCLEI